MTSYAKGEKPAVGVFNGFHHCHFYVGNAKATASYFVTRLGFTRVAYRGLETQSREAVTHVVKQGRIVYAFTSTYVPDSSHPINQHIALHGDGVHDVAFVVDDTQAIFDKAVQRQKEISESEEEADTNTNITFEVIAEPHEEKDENGSVIVATIRPYGDTVHTFVQIVDYTGPFMPGFRAVEEGEDVKNDDLPEVGLGFIDHVVSNHMEGDMKKCATWYEKHLDFHQFWSVDDKQVFTEYSALRSIVMTDWHGTVKLPINEPAEGKRKSQIQEYVDYYGGPGVQHIAMNTDDIVTAVDALRKRGMKFLRVYDSYYDDLRQRLAASPVKVLESLDELQRLNILVDFDDQGYLLQIFTENLQDRPTVFLEVIQRNNHNGFGAGNFKALFESIEREQAKRGNL